MNSSTYEAQFPTYAETDEDLIISAENVSKKFCRDLKKAYIYGLVDILAEIFGQSRKSNKLRRQEFWALHDVNFQIGRGQSIGLIGSNGSGKTTLLLIIAGLLKPDTGVVKVKGRVAPLSVLGAGFKPKLTGRENVYINMSIFGLSQQEIDQRFSDVIDFAEVWEAVDAPVRTYSKGMRARLGFACAIYTDPDILLVDEVLAVGDVSFRKKCYRKLCEMQDQGVSVVMVAHDASAILASCEYAIYLSRGKTIVSGLAEDVVKQYETDLAANKPKKKKSKVPLLLSKASKKVQQEAPVKTSNTPSSDCLKIYSVYFQDSLETEIPTIATEKRACLCVECEASTSLEGVSLNIIVQESAAKKRTLLDLDSAKDKGFLKTAPGKFIVQLQIPTCVLLPGNYSATIKLTHKGKQYQLLDVLDSFNFQVNGEMDEPSSIFYQPRAWDLKYI